MGPEDTQREEDRIAEMLCYELCRNYTDRIIHPKKRSEMLKKFSEISKTEFLSTHLTAERIDNLLLGNYHELRKGAHIKYVEQTPNEQKVRTRLRKKLRSETSNHYMEVLLEQPGALKNIFRAARPLLREQGHCIIVSPSGSCKREYVQMCAIFAEAIVIEPDVAKYRHAFEFRACLQNAMRACVRYSTPVVFLVDDHHCADLAYADVLHAFITLFPHEEVLILTE